MQGSKMLLAKIVLVYRESVVNIKSLSFRPETDFAVYCTVKIDEFVPKNRPRPSCTCNSSAFQAAAGGRQG
jgi:hypothetical protein